MRPTSKQLAMRDPALASALGILPGSQRNQDFGADFGADFGSDDYGDDAGDDYGDDMTGDFGDDAGAEFGLARRAPSQAALHRAWAVRARQKAVGRRRRRLLNPNLDSDIVVERYSFSMSQVLTVGTAATISMTQNPQVTFRPQRLTMNTPSVGFVEITGIQVANVNAQVGGIADAWDFNANGVGMAMDLPTLSPANQASVSGSYTGFAPAPLQDDQSFRFIASFKGPAIVAGGSTNLG